MSKIADWLDRQDREQDERFIRERSIGQVYHNERTRKTVYSSEEVRRKVNEQRISNF